MSTDEVFAKVCDVIVEQLEVDAERVVRDAKIVDDLGADSLDVVELVMAMEGEFDVEVDEDEAQNFSTVGDVVTYLSDLTC